MTPSNSHRINTPALTGPSVIASHSPPEPTSWRCLDGWQVHYRYDAKNVLARIFETETGLLDCPMQECVAQEIRHGRFLAQHGAGEIWNWESPAGKLRWARRVKMLSSYLTPGMTALELGCGVGYFTQELVRSGANIVAIDVSPELLEIAKTNYSTPNVRYQIENACELSYDDSVFDSVVGSSVLHHLEIEAALREIYRVLKPTGTIYFTEPNMLNPQIAIQKNILWIKRKLGDSPEETAFFRWPLRRLLEQTGYRDIQIDPFDFLHPKTPVPLNKAHSDRAERQLLQKILPNGAVVVDAGANIGIYSEFLSRCVERCRPFVRTFA